MLLAFDTETTGLPAWDKPSSDAAQPHLVQLALVQFSDDGTETEATSVIVKPNGWTIPPEVAAIHGITHERAMDEGIPEEQATAMFVMAQARCSLRIAHNESFDRRIMRIAMTRLGLERDFIEAIESRRSYCTCKQAAPIVNLPPTDRMIAAGFRGPKSPNLAECIRHFFKETLDGAHDALVDARACARIYWRLQQKEAA